MPITAAVNYHIASAERQAYHMDAGGVEGNVLSPAHNAIQVRVNDVRSGESMVYFENDSVGFFKSPSTITKFSKSKDWEDTYNLELTSLLRHKINCTEVIIFDHTVRIDDPNSKRKPARNVHSDYSPEGADQRLEDILGSERASEWSAEHFGFVNVWRPIQHIVESAPLGFVKPKSVAVEDWLTLDLIYPDRVGQIMGLIANKKHEWLYYSKMTPEEIAVFNIYDNQGLASIAHSALDIVDIGHVTVPRMSIESRTLVRY